MRAATLSSKTCLATDDGRRHLVPDAVAGEEARAARLPQAERGAAAEAARSTRPGATESEPAVAEREDPAVGLPRRLAQTPGGISVPTAVDGEQGRPSAEYTCHMADECPE